MKIALLVISILKEVAAIAAAALAGTGAKTPEEVRQQIKDAADRHDDQWLEAACAAADAEYNRGI